MFYSNIKAQTVVGIKNHFNHISYENGLPQTYFEPIVQDKKGYMWFGTRNGLIKYDGYTFTTFQYDPLNKNSMATSFASHLCVDDLNNIWIAGDYGLTQFDQHKGVFTNYRHDVYNKNSIPSDNISCLISDSQGFIWIGTDNGLSYFDHKTEKFTLIKDSLVSNSPESRMINYLMIDHSKMLWIASSDGVVIYNPFTKKLNHFLPPDKYYLSISKEILCMMEDHSGSVWFGLGNHGIYRYDPQNNVSKIYRHNKKDVHSLSVDGISIIYEDSRNTVWVGSYESGLNRYNPISDNFSVAHADANKLHSLSSDHIMNIFEDVSGTLWIGTNGGGLNNCYPYENKFIVFQNWDKDYASHNPTSLYKDKNGRIFMSTFGDGVEEFNPITGSFKQYKISSADDKLNSINFCYATFEDSNGDFWVGSFDESLSKLNLSSGKFTTVHSDSSNHNQINCIVEDSEKRLWLGTNRGLKCYDLKSKQFLGFEDIYRDTNQLSIDATVNLYFDQDGILCITGTLGGLTLLNTKTSEIKIYKHIDNNPHSISCNSLLCIYPSVDNGVWIGTAGGLNILNTKTGEFDIYTEKDGLPDNSVNAILEDNNHNFWLSTNNGICEFKIIDSLKEGKTKHVYCRKFDMSDGLPGSEFGWSNCLKGDNGILYFGSMAGLVAIKPEEIKYNEFIPPVVITGLQVLNKSVLQKDSTGILNQPVDETNDIKLAYTQNVFSFTFAALSFIHPEKNQYAYKLEGFDKDWINTDATKRFATYTNLDAGDYIFKVKASNNDGLWNNIPAEIKVIIVPPFWKTWWFKFLVLVAILISIFLVVQSRLEKFREISRIRNKIASDLHDDLGATLSSISIMSEIVKQQVKQQSPQSVAILEKIGISSRNMIESVNDMVWAINPQNDSFENIIKRMKTFASEILSAKDINFNFDFDKTLLQSKLRMETRRNFYLIFKEAVNNIAKYSEAINAYISLNANESNLRLIIRDDGKGFDINLIQRGNGLNNMQQRAEEMEANYRLESLPGQGTKVELEFKNES